MAAKFHLRHHLISPVLPSLFFLLAPTLFPFPSPSPSSSTEPIAAAAAAQLCATATLSLSLLVGRLRLARARSTRLFLAKSRWVIGGFLMVMVFEVGSGYGEATIFAGIRERNLDSGREQCSIVVPEGYFCLLKDSKQEHF